MPDSNTLPKKLLVFGGDAVLQNYVMRTALDYARGGDYGKPCIRLKLRSGQPAAVANGGTNLAERPTDIILPTACIRHIRVHSLFKAELCRAAKVVPLPVPRAVPSPSPVSLILVAFDANLLGGAFVKP